MPDTFTWTTQETFEAVNVLTSTEERYEQARWMVWMWLYPEDSLRDYVAKFSVADPIDLDKVDWQQVAKVFEWEGDEPPPQYIPEQP